MKEKFDTTLYAQHNQYLSFLDLEKVDGFIEAWKSQDENKFIDILHTNGMDKSFGYKIEQGLHVPRTERNQKKFEYGLRVTFKERTDKAFEPYKSVEDICRDDPSSVIRAGMRASLNLGVSINDCMEEALSVHTKLLKNMLEEDKLNKERV